MTSGDPFQPLSPMMVQVSASRVPELHTRLTAHIYSYQHTRAITQFAYAVVRACELDAQWQTLNLSPEV